MSKNKIILTTGTFNIVHAGHIELFEYCKQFDGKVIVGLNSDNYVIKKYGSKSVPLENRLKVLEQIKLIDEVVVFKETTPVKLIFKPPFILGAISNSDEIYWLLTEESICISRPLIIEGFMLRGGYPSFSR